MLPIAQSHVRHRHTRYTFRSDGLSIHDLEGANAIVYLKYALFLNRQSSDNISATLRTPTIAHPRKYSMIIVIVIWAEHLRVSCRRADATSSVVFVAYLCYIICAMIMLRMENGADEATGQNIYCNFINKVVSSINCVHKRCELKQVSV